MSACNRPAGFTAWRKAGRGRWKALGTFPTEEEARERIERARRDSPAGDYTSLILPAGESPGRPQRIQIQPRGYINVR